MATYSDKQLEEIRALAKLSFTPKEIAVLIEADTKSLVEDVEVLDSPAYKSFYAGFYEGEKEVREKIFQLADQGSSPAQTAALEIIQKAKLKMLER